MVPKYNKKLCHEYIKRELDFNNIDKEINTLIITIKLSPQEIIKTKDEGEEKCLKKLSNQFHIIIV